jgi:hypothetical protein
MVDILAQKPRTVQLVGRTGTPDRARAVQGLRDFLTGLTDYTADWDVCTPKDALYAAYLRWAKANRPCDVLGPNQFTGEVRMAQGTGTSQRHVKGIGTTTVFPFVTVRPGLV